MQKYLHIWKIFCTFASDLGIVPDRTIKKIRVMKMLTLCRVSIGGKVFKLTGLFWKGEKVAFAYRIYLGRRRWEPCDYRTIDYALKVWSGIIEGQVLHLLSEGAL